MSDTLQEYKYGSPLEPGTPIEIVSPETHRAIKSTRHALDFLCPEGTKVRAARDGTVILVKKDSHTHVGTEEEIRAMIEQTIGQKLPKMEEFKSWPSPKKQKLEDLVTTALQQISTSANMVRVKHKDGTLAEYVHFAPDQIDVQEGQKITRGDLLGLTGMTGIITIPHLHFSIMEPEKGESIPVQFEQEDIQIKVHKALQI